MRFRPVLMGMVALLTFGCQEQSSVPSRSTKAPSRWEERGNKNDKIVYAMFTCNWSDPWVQREEIHATQTAVKNHARLLVYHESNAEHLIPDIDEAVKRGALGIILFAPDCRQGTLIVSTVHQDHAKLIVINHDLDDPKHLVPKADKLLLDYEQASSLAAKKMVSAAVRKKWDMRRTGAVIFKSPCLCESNVVVNQETSRLVKAGVAKSMILVLNADDGRISTARRVATAEISKRVNVRNWFIGGYNDEVVVGGIRAVEDVHIGVSRVVGVGIDGDGSIYDLQRPVENGLVASVLLPAGTIGERSSQEMYDWIENKIRPFNDRKFSGILLDRYNVRNLKQIQHLME